MLRTRMFAAATPAVVAAFYCCVSPAWGATKVDSATFGAVEARAIGPAAMSGRVSAIDGVRSNPNTLYVGAANGGVWKTTNAGTTFKPVFDRYTQSIGAITIDQKKPETVWVGTGEVWVRNSVSAGTGLYRTKDGGDNWTFMGLPKSERIAKIILDPRDADTVYVAVLGALWSDSEDRGLYKTTDGGKTWNKILYVNPSTGCADIAIDPQEPDNIYAAMWQVRRQPWTFQSGGPGSGLHRSSDGGKTWTKVTAGLPEGNLGRIALLVPEGRASTVYAMVEAAKSGFYRSDDQGRTFQLQSNNGSLNSRPFYFNALFADPRDYKVVYKMGMVTSVSRDGGKTWTQIGGATHSDHHALWVDTSSGALFLGTDGGVYRSNDQGITWNFFRNLPLAQFYHVSADNARPYQVYGGLQDNGSWAGPSAGVDGDVSNKDWLNVGFGDGFHVWPHPKDRDVVYSQWQGGKLLRYTRSTGELKSISPSPKPGEPNYRFNWNAGVAQSSVNPDTIYVGAQFLFRSRDRGESWEKISPDLTTNDPEKQKQEESGGLSIDNTTAENHCSIMTIAESPLDARVIWVGTDDGNVQVTRDGGKTWKNLFPAGGPPRGTWVSSIEASRFVAGRAYVAFDGHQTGDMKTYILRTDDFGATWTSIVTDDVKGFAHVIREDTARQDLLFAGTEFGLFLTIDGGKQWAQFTGNLPPVAVRDLYIHPRDHDLIIATHGRGIYIVDDITPIRKLTEEVLESSLTVLQGGPVPIRFRSMVQDFSGVDEFSGRGPSSAAFITYYMKERYTLGDLNIEVFDADGKSITKLVAGRRRGINRVPWPMRLKPPKVPSSSSLEGGLIAGPMLPEGVYTARIIKGKETYLAKLELIGDPRLPHSAEDRKLQFQTVMKLYNAVERLAFLAAQAADLRDQARAKKSAELDGFANRIDALRKTWVSSSSAPEAGQIRLREEIGAVYGEVMRFGGRPTRSQLDRTATLEQKVEEASRNYESLLRDAPKQVAELKKLTREEYDRRQQ